MLCACQPVLCAPQVPAGGASDHRQPEAFLGRRWSRVRSSSVRGGAESAIRCMAYLGVGDVPDHRRVVGAADRLQRVTTETVVPDRHTDTVNAA